MRLLKLITGTLLFALGVNANAQQVTPDGTLWENIAYGPLSAQKMDFYQPTSNKPVKGLIVWVHGGGWTSGDKKDGNLNYLIPHFFKGYAVVSINYRLGASGVFPNSGMDVVEALSSIENAGCPTCNSAAWKTIKAYSQNGILLAGASAGGYLSVIGGGTYLNLRLSQNKSTNLKCINNNVGPTDLRPYSQYSLASRDMIKAYAGNNLSIQHLSEMSPTWWLGQGSLTKSATKVKWILNYNNGDNIVPPSTTLSFTAGLKQLGAQVYTNIVTDYVDGKYAVSHNISTQTGTAWINQAVGTCFGY